MSAPVEVLAAIDGCLAGTREALPSIPKKHREECTMFIAEMEQARTAVAELFEKGRQLSAHLEHAIAIANVGSPDTVHVRHPIRVALDQFDEALRAAGGAA